ncbi:MAG TPA: glycosyltransferase family 39 protein, partial [Prolixibacteraceae bacterium]
NPLYYFISIPFARLFGVNLFTLRLVALIAYWGSGFLVFKVIHEKTDSYWWAFIAVGFFAAAYQAMDASLDSGHSDSWFLFTALLGTYLIDRAHSRYLTLAGVIILVAGFWFKQHGVLFVAGALIFLSWKNGIKNSLIYWAVATLLGPFLYIFLGNQLFGPYFHYFTWEVPRRWSEFNLVTVRRSIGFILKRYPMLALVSGFFIVWTGWKGRKTIDIWHFQFIFAVLSGFMGALDPGSSNNVFTTMGTWFILFGVLGLRLFFEQIFLIRQYKLHSLALFVSLAFFFYNPLEYIIPPTATDSYQDLVSVLQKTNGSIYAPSIGELQSDYNFYPKAHWAALEDMIRGPGIDTSNNPNTRHLLEPVIKPEGPAYILAYYPLEAYSWMQFLNNYYVLDTDFGDRYKSLKVLPARWEHGWPRYLYRFSPEKAAR